ncbi:unnamed protein product [Allacma fusca]|uniref:Cuticle protein n=1 Tax=Allacma fusca TaxID=39272 RepID=A0A8J2LIB1_9HEXA|nr:unnamed protein product [Allacma fusca]
MIKITSILAIVGLAAAAPGVTYNAAPYTGYSGYTGYTGYTGLAHNAYTPQALTPAGYHHVAAAPAVAHYAAAPAVVRAEPYDPHPQYNYGYSVSDGYTGDQKSHTESRDGDVVSGQYSLVEPDGAVRTVTYTADPVNGFNAVVDRQRPVAVKAVAPAPIIRAAVPIATSLPGAYTHGSYITPTYTGYSQPGVHRYI